MRIEELKDSRDRAACERAEKGPSVRQMRQADKFWRRVVTPDPVVSNFDDEMENEFQTGQQKRRERRQHTMHTESALGLPI